MTGYGDWLDQAGGGDLSKLKSVSTAAATYAPATSDAVVIHLTSATGQTVTLPAAAGNLDRRYWLVNPTASVKTVSAYLGLSGLTLTTLQPQSSIGLISDGTVWRQFSGPASIVGTNLLKKLTANIIIPNWVAPFTKVPLTDLDIVVPAGGFLDARYSFIASTGNANRSPFGFKTRGYAAGDNISGRLSIPNYPIPTTIPTGQRWYEIYFSNSFPDNDANAGRGLDMTVTAPLTDLRGWMEIRYQNNTTSPKTFGLDFGADINFALSGVNLTMKAGTSVVYSVFA